MYPELRNYKFLFQELNISSGLVEEAMGYIPGQSPEPFPDMINEALSKYQCLFEIQGSVLISNLIVDEDGGFFSIEGKCFFAERRMLEQISDSEVVAVFICTAGAGIGKKSRQIMEFGDFMEGYILDVLGSVTVEAAIEKIQDFLVMEMESRNLRVTNRYSPGYCGWALTEQKKLFSLFPVGSCGINLSESCLMEPVKSISGIMGFGHTVEKHLHECQLCELENCMYRKIRLARLK